MRILFIAPRYHTNQYETITTLIDNGNEVFFYSLYENAGSSDYSNIKPSVIPLAKSFYLLAKIFNWEIKNNNRKIREKGFPSFLFILNVFKQLKPDLIIVRDLNYCSMLFLTISRYMKIPRILYDQNPLYRKRKPFQKRLIMRLAELLFFGSVIRTTVVAGDHTSGAASKNTYLLPFVVKINKDIVSSESKNEVTKIFCVGKFQKRKNHLMLIKAIEKLPVHLTIIGKVDTNEQKKHLQYIYNYIEKNELNEKILVINDVPYKDMGKFYKDCDIFILPSSGEQFGISILEAMSYGKPVVCSSDAGVRHCVNNRKNGIIFKKNDINSLKEAIDYLLLPEIDLEEMGKQSLIHIEKCHNSKIYMNNLKMILKKHYPKTEKKLQCNL